jgi:hypothetical protein
VESIGKILRELGDMIGRLIDTLLGGKESEPQMIPIPVRNNNRRVR